MTSNGADYAWSHPSPASLKAAGMSFVCRYLATDKSKALSKTEATALAAVGIWSVVVWETTANRMLGGKAAGVADAKAAAAQAASCGMPTSRPIYFAADWDATEAQQSQINAYLDGAASVLGASRVGIYGGYYPVKRALDAKKAVWAWQTRAWSGGQWDARAHIRQGAYVTIGGVQCDANTSMKTDFGQWMPGKTPTPVPTPEDTVALTAADKTWITSTVKSASFAGVWATDAIKAPADAPDIKTNATWQAQSVLTDIQARVRAAAPVALSDAQLDQLAAKVAPVVAERLAELLAARLQS